MKKAVASLIIAITAFSLMFITQSNLASANFIHFPVPEHSFVINANGTVLEKVNSDKIQLNGTVYQFKEDVFGGLVIHRDNVTIDGGGYTLYGNGSSTGIFLQGRNNITIRNLKVTNFTIGIEIAWSANYFGVDCSNIVIQRNVIESCEYGILLDNPKNVSISENRINHNSIGVSGSGQRRHNILLTGNSLANNKLGFEAQRINSIAYGNNFMDNTVQANATKEYWYDDFTNVWHNDSKIGNFWSDYRFTDPDGDGIGNGSYEIDNTNRDDYPMVKPFLMPEFIENPDSKTKVFEIPIILLAIAFVSLLLIVLAGVLLYVKKWVYRSHRTRIFFVSMLICLLLPLVVNANLVQARNSWEPSPLPEHKFEIQESGDVVEIFLSEKILGKESVYTFTQDATGGVLVGCDNIVIDGAGHELLGNGAGVGFFLQGRNNVTIKNLRISNFSCGIELAPYSTSSNLLFEGNIFINNKYGIYDLFSHNLNATRNIITSSHIGIYAWDTGLVLNENCIAGNDIGIKIIDCGGSIYHNRFVKNTVQVSSDGGVYGNDPCSIIWENDNKGNYWSEYKGSDLNDDGVGDYPHVFDVNYIDHYPLTTDKEAPNVQLLSPQIKTYDNAVELIFHVNEPVLWMGYSLDNKETVRLLGNTSLTNLPFGLHSIVVYANDTACNMAASETINFTVLNLSVTITFVFIVAAIVTSALIYFYKFKIKSSRKSLG